VAFLILLVLGFLLVWVFVLLPQRRRLATHARMVENLKVGDEVLTVGGLYGDVTEIGEDELALEVAPGVEVRVATRAVATVTPPGTYVDETDEDDRLEEGSDALDGGEPTDSEEPAAAEVDEAGDPTGPAPSTEESRR
jgi:preprotein translocase subunit YajC